MKQIHVPRASHLQKKVKRWYARLVPIVEGIDSAFFGKATGKEQKNLMQILAKLIAGISDE